MLRRDHHGDRHDHGPNSQAVGHSGGKGSRKRHSHRQRGLLRLDDQHRSRQRHALRRQAPAHRIVGHARQPDDHRHLQRRFHFPCRQRHNQCGPGGIPIYVLNSTASGALTISGNAAINVPGVVDVDSNSSSAACRQRQRMIMTAASIQVVGSYSSSNWATPSSLRNQRPGPPPLPTPLRASPSRPRAARPTGAVNISGQRVADDQTRHF